MVAMLIVHYASKGDITKLEAYFFNDYRDGDRVFNVSFIDSKEYFQFMDDKICASLRSNWTQANVVFEYELDAYLLFTSNKTKYFLYG